MEILSPEFFTAFLSEFPIISLINAFFLSSSFHRPNPIEPSMGSLLLLEGTLASQIILFIKLFFSNYYNYSKMRVIFMRHGESKNNELRIQDEELYQNQRTYDPELSEKGTLESLNTGKTFKDLRIKIDEIRTSAFI